jgi:hypothetical protein
MIATNTITRYGFVNAQVLPAFPEDAEQGLPFAVFENDIEVVSVQLQVWSSKLSSIRGKQCDVRVAISQSVRVA